MGLGRSFFSNVFGKPEWTLPTEEEITKKIIELKREIDTMPNSPEKTKAIYTLANQLQILRLILHEKKKRKYRPDAKGKWVWIEEEEYDGRNDA